MINVTKPIGGINGELGKKVPTKFTEILGESFPIFLGFIELWLFNMFNCQAKQILLYFRWNIWSILQSGSTKAKILSHPGLCNTHFQSQCGGLAQSDHLTTSSIGRGCYHSQWGSSLHVSAQSIWHFCLGCRAAHALCSNQTIYCLRPFTMFSMPLFSWVQGQDVPD